VTIHTFDLEKAMDGDPQHNLPLKDLDQTVIHSTWEYVDKYTVSIKAKSINRAITPTLPI